MITMILSQNNVSTKLFLSFSIIVCLTITLLYYFQFLPVYKKLANSSLNDKLNIMIRLYQNTLSSAIQTSDDVTLLNSVEDIMKFDGVTTAYILDKTGKVLISNRTSEWGKIYSDYLTKNALQSNYNRIQESEKDNEFLFSAPLSTSTILCVGCSKEKAEKNLGYIKQKYIYTSLIIIVAAILITLAVIYQFITKRYEGLKHNIQSVTLSKGGTLPDLGKDEFGEISALINSLIEAVTTPRGPTCADNNAELIREIIKRTPLEIMVIDSENKIAAISKRFAELISADENSVICKHIMDVIKNSELISFITQSAEDPGKTTNTLISGNRIDSYALPNSAGILLFLK